MQSWDKSCACTDTGITTAFFSFLIIYVSVETKCMTTNTVIWWCIWQKFKKYKHTLIRMDDLRHTHKFYINLSFPLLCLVKKNCTVIKVSQPAGLFMTLTLLFSYKQAYAIAVFIYGCKVCLLGACLWHEICSSDSLLQCILIHILVKIYLTESSSLTNICSRVSRYDRRWTVISGEGISAIVHQRSCLKYNFSE